MNRFSIENNTCFELYASCPVCFDKEENGATYWEHHYCGGQMYTGDNAMIFCDKCQQEVHVSKIKF